MLKFCKEKWAENEGKFKQSYHKMKRKLGL